MAIPNALISQHHLGSYFCPEWELRVTGRCLSDDLGQPVDAPFADLLNVEIVKSFTKDRFDLRFADGTGLPERMHVRGALDASETSEKVVSRLVEEDPKKSCPQFEV